MLSVSQLEWKFARKLLPPPRPRQLQQLERQLAPQLVGQLPQAPQQKHPPQLLQKHPPQLLQKHPPQLLQKQPLLILLVENKEMELMKWKIKKSTIDYFVSICDSSPIMDITMTLFNPARRTFKITFFPPSVLSILKYLHDVKIAF